MTLMWGHSSTATGVRRRSSTGQPPRPSSLACMCNAPGTNLGRIGAVFFFFAILFFAVSTLRNVVGDENLMPATLQRRTRSDARMVVLVTIEWEAPVHSCLFWHLRDPAPPSVY